MNYCVCALMEEGIGLGVWLATHVDYLEHRNGSRNLAKISEHIFSVAGVSRSRFEFGRLGDVLEA